MKTRSRCLLFLCIAISASFRADVANAHEIAKELHESLVRLWDSLDPPQQAAIQFDFNDQLRKDWQFVPMERQGLAFGNMKPNQRLLAMSLLQTALSHRGFSQSMQVMALEQILHEMENNNPQRDPENYHLFVFGKPSLADSWGWRIEGHHLSINFTVVGGKTVVSTPLFFGANPAEVRQGPQTGLRVLGTEEDLGRQLVEQLTPEQKKVAVITDQAPSEIINGPGRDASPLQPAGIQADNLTEPQQQILKQLILSFVGKLRTELAEQDMARIEEAGFGKIHFAWAGQIQKNNPHYYRVQGPTFIMEYDNTQNDANHIHLVWRDFNNDFGEDLLKKHYESNDDFKPDQDTLPAAPPIGATVLFDGTNRGFVNMNGEATDWPVEDGALVSTHGGSNTNHLVSRFHFRDADIHVEFMTPAKGEGNSGVYIHGNYELQILNKRDAPLSMQDIGSLYGFSEPLVMAGRDPEQWQVYDIRYRAPRRNADGEITEMGTITAWLNGKLVQNHVRFGEPRSSFHPYRHGTTPYLQSIWKLQKKTMTGPVFLQDHNSPVRFRNVWIKPLDDKSFWYPSSNKVQ